MFYLKYSYTYIYIIFSIYHRVVNNTYAIYSLSQTYLSRTTHYSTYTGYVENLYKRVKRNQLFDNRRRYIYIYILLRSRFRHRAPDKRRHSINSKFYDVLECSTDTYLLTIIEKQKLLIGTQEKSIAELNKG